MAAKPKPRTLTETERTVSLRAVGRRSSRSFPPSPEFAAQANATAELYEAAKTDRLG